jgi:protein-S-isoprenylcysteine O-methyltransferase Ste14
MPSPAHTPALESPKADWAFRHRDLIATVPLAPAIVIGLLSRPALAPGSASAVVLNLAAWTLFLAGAAHRFWATIYIGGRKRDMIVSEGPYSLCRHPLYLASFLMALSAGLFLESVIVTAAAILAGIAYLLTTVPQEEAALARQHPRGWADYAARVPRVCPRAIRWHTPARVTVDVQSLRDEVARASRWVLLPLLAEVAMYLRTLPWWPGLW